MGELIALAGALCFSFSGILLKVGQRRRPRDTGLFMTTLVNLGLYLILLAGMLIWGGAPGLALEAIGFFVLAGFTNSLVGRWAWFQSVRVIGPSRATSLKGTHPIFATALAFVLLGQPVSARTLLGLTAVVAGVAILTRGDGAADNSGGATAAGIRAPTYRLLTRLARSGRTRGILLGLLAGTGYGAGAVFRGLGVATTPSPTIGALIGSLVALSSILVSDLLRGNLGQRWSDNVRDVPRAFVAAGVLAGFGQLAGFASLLYTTVAASVAVAATEPLLTALLASMVFRATDTVTVRSVAAMLGISAGVAAVVLR